MKKPMKIAFLVYNFPNLSETFILNRVTGLIDRGHEIDIFGLAGPPSPAAKVHPDVQKYDLLKRTRHAPAPPTGLSRRLVDSMRHLPMYIRQNPLAAVRTFDLLSNRSGLPLFYAAMPLLAAGSYDVVHCFFGPIGILGMRLRDAGLIRGKLIVSLLGFDMSEFLISEGKGAYSDLFRAGDMFLPNCEYFKQRMIELGCPQQRITVHRCGIDCGKFVFRERRLGSDKEVKIVTVGRLVEKKGIEYAIRAVAELAKTGRKISYRIIGDGPIRASLETQVRELELGDTVVFLGSMHQQEVIGVLDDAHLFLAPSVTGKNGDQEGIPNVLKEAMAMGIPVIGTWHSGIPELIEDGISGFLAAERDVADLAAKLKILAENPQRWPEMGRAARARVEQFYNIETINDELVAIYDNLAR